MEAKAVMILLAIALASVGSISAAKYDISSLETYQVSAIRSRTLPTSVFTSKPCQNFALGVFGLYNVPVNEQTLVLDSAELFERLLAWAETSPKVKPVFKSNFEPLFKGCASALIPELPPKLPASKWPLDALEKFSLVSAAREMENKNTAKECRLFTEKVFAIYDETHKPTDLDTVQVSLELLLQLQKHYSQAKNILLQRKANSVIKGCKHWYADRLQEQVAGLSRSKISDETQNLIRLVYPEWRPSAIFDHDDD